ncbi:hypothetical protein BU17DRAFT_72180 [Hysterangium stoloniferum]|nr:hypothetical protein BU17DRAFT_72180 [Hysterangium stoloniferum]
MAHRQRAAVVKYKCDCAGCDAALFSSKENARGHVRRTHFRQLDQKPFKCLHPEWFASLSAARRHVKDKAKARYPDCKKLLGRKNYVSTTYRKRCKGRKHLAKAGLVAGAPKQSKLYFATAINPTGGYSAAYDVVIDAGGLMVLMSLSTRNMDNTSKLRKVAAMQSLQPHLAA